MRQPEEAAGAFSPLKGAPQGTDSQHDASGTFHLLHLRAGIYHVLATDAEGANGVARAVQVRSGKDAAGVKIQLSAGATITGQVAALEDGRSLAGVQVGRMPGKMVQTDSADKFSVPGLVAGSKVALQFVKNDPKDARYESREVWIPSDSRFTDAGIIKMIGTDKASAEDESGLTGLRVAHEGGHPVVTGMFEESPATSSGIKVRDRILSIEGKSTQDLGQGVLDQWLAGPEGTTVTVRVQTDEEPARDVKMERRAR